jgi:hypothetical protein
MRQVGVNVRAALSSTTANRSLLLLLSSPWRSLQADARAAACMQVLRAQQPP